MTKHHLEMADQPSPLRRYPKYGDNHIEESIVFDTDKRSATFGRPYHYSKEHKIKDRNKFLYKLTNDLNDDSFTCASGSQSNYSELSYRSGFEDYYYPMPPSFQEVHKEEPVIVQKSNPPKNYGFSTYNPPFELRNRSVRICAEALRATNNKLLPGERKKTQSEKLLDHKHHQQREQQKQRNKQVLITITEPHEQYKQHETVEGDDEEEDFRYVLKKPKP